MFQNEHVKLYSHIMILWHKFATFLLRETYQLVPKINSYLLPTGTCEYYDFISSSYDTCAKISRKLRQKDRKNLISLHI